MAAARDHQKFLGLGTEEALAKLRIDVEKLLIEQSSGESIIEDPDVEKARVSGFSPTLPFDWWSVFLLISTAASLLVSQVFANYVSVSLTLEAVMILGFCAFNFWLCKREAHLREDEIFTKLRLLLSEIRRCESDRDQWKDHDHIYPPLYLPTSPSISLQWTYRNGSLVNLPTALLVKGDVIVLRPGSPAPAKCEEAAAGFQPEKLEDNSRTKATVRPRSSHISTLNRGEQFLPPSSDATDSPHAPLPQIRRPFTTRTFILLETPVLTNFRFIIRHLNQRHPSLVNMVQRHVRLRIVEKIFVVVLILVALVAVIVFYLIYRHLPSSCQPDWSRLLLVDLVFCLFPVLPVIRIPWTFLIQCYASACVIKTLKEFGSDPKGNAAVGSEDSEGPSGQFLSGSNKLLEVESLSVQGDGTSSIVKDFSQELLRLPKTPMHGRSLFRLFLKRMRGPSGHMDRICEVTHNLATITAICCIDKYGILSFPDPTPEKVFFLTSQEAGEEEEGKESMGSRASVVSLFGEESVENGAVATANAKGKDLIEAVQTRALNPTVSSGDEDVDGGAESDGDVFDRSSRVEVLNISHKEERSGYRLQFDDPRWRKYVANLKPLGLHILVNICNDDAIAKSLQFSDHLSCVSQQLGDDVAEADLRPLQVLERRCMCDLSSMIGFTPKAKDIFALQHQAYTYRKVKLNQRQRHSEECNGGANSSAVRARHFVRQKVTIPSMTAVLMRENDSGMIQLMSQGTADVVLDSCSDFWDGFDLVPLDDAQRKKVMDFFQRNNLASYCTALSYCPLGCASKLGPFYEDMYVELPSDSKDILDVLLSPSLMRKMGERLANPYMDQQLSLWQRGVPTSPFVSASTVKGGDQYLSVESLCREKENEFGVGLKQAGIDCGKLLAQLSLDQVKTPGNAALKTAAALSFTSESNSLQSIAECIRMQFEQIFIGMVTMQYQAKLDVIHLIEELEKACIRFVHFSKENELRSRVFTEKMGLEAGWNCHISLEEPASVNDNASGHQNSSRQSSSRSGTQVSHPNSKKSLPGDRASSTASSFATSGGRQPSGRDSISPSRVEPVLPRWLSCPSALHADSSQVRFHDDDDIINPSTDGANATSDALLLSPPDPEIPQGSPDRKTDVESGKSQFSEGGYGISDQGTVDPDNIELEQLGDIIGPFCRTEDDIDATSDLTGNSSHPTTSGMTESTDRFPIDFSNRAKLPRGIANVRPHIEQVDNVPLLVSLFTDCTPETTTEMMEVMQEYGECVACIGSCANFENYRQFSTGDVTLSVEPLYPRVCSTGGCASAHAKMVRSNTAILSKVVSETAPPGSPIWLSNQINTLPCTLLFHRNDNITICALIALSRHLVLISSSAAEFLLYGQFTLTLIHFLPILLLAASPLSPSQILWISLVILPLLSLSFLGCPMDPYVMTLAPPKKELFSSSYFMRHLGIYLSKFGPTILMSLTVFYLIIYSFCSGKAQDTVSFSNETSLHLPSEFTTTSPNPSSSSSSSCCPFFHFTPIVNSSVDFCKEGSEVTGPVASPPGLVLAQSCVCFFLVIYFLVTSSNFVHRYHSLWRRNPLKNRVWALTLPVIFMLHLVFCCVQALTYSDASSNGLSLTSVPIEAWLLLLLWPATLLGILEAIKHTEIKQFVRQQKLQRLNFDTKLGMNSPF